jgi:hypothetical protein
MTTGRPVHQKNPRTDLWVDLMAQELFGELLQSPSYNVPGYESVRKEVWQGFQPVKEEKCP